MDSLDGIDLLEFEFDDDDGLDHGDNQNSNQNTTNQNLHFQTQHLSLLVDHNLLSPRYEQQYEPLLIDEIHRDTNNVDQLQTENLRKSHHFRNVNKNFVKNKINIDELEINSGNKPININEYYSKKIIKNSITINKQVGLISDDHDFYDACAELIMTSKEDEFSKALEEKGLKTITIEEYKKLKKLDAINDSSSDIVANITGGQYKKKYKHLNEHNRGIAQTINSHQQSTSSIRKVMSEKYKILSDTKYIEGKLSTVSYVSNVDQLLSDIRNKFFPGKKKIVLKHFFDGTSGKGKIKSGFTSVLLFPIAQNVPHQSQKEIIVFACANCKEHDFVEWKSVMEKINELCKKTSFTCGEETIEVRHIHVYDLSAFRTLDRKDDPKWMEKYKATRLMCFLNHCKNDEVFNPKHLQDTFLSLNCAGILFNDHDYQYASNEIFNRLYSSKVNTNRRKVFAIKTKISSQLRTFKGQNDLSVTNLKHCAKNLIKALNLNSNFEKKCFVLVKTYLWNQLHSKIFRLIKYRVQRTNFTELVNYIQYETILHHFHLQNYISDVIDPKNNVDTGFCPFSYANANLLFFKRAYPRLGCWQWKKNSNFKNGMSRKDMFICILHGIQRQTEGAFNVLGRSEGLQKSITDYYSHTKTSDLYTVDQEFVKFLCGKGLDHKGTLSVDFGKKTKNENERSITPGKCFPIKFSHCPWIVLAHDQIVDVIKQYEEQNEWKETEISLLATPRTRYLSFLGILKTLKVYFSVILKSFSSYKVYYEEKQEDFFNIINNKNRYFSALSSKKEYPGMDCHLEDYKSLKHLKLSPFDACSNNMEGFFGDLKATAIAFSTSNNLVKDTKTMIIKKLLSIFDCDSFQIKAEEEFEKKRKRDCTYKRGTECNYSKKFTNNIVNSIKKHTKENENKMRIEIGKLFTKFIDTKEIVYPDVLKASYTWPDTEPLKKTVWDYVKPLLNEGTPKKCETEINESVRKKVDNWMKKVQKEFSKTWKERTGRAKRKKNPQKEKRYNDIVSQNTQSSGDESRV